VTELIVNKAAWDSLPPDLQEIVRAACGACQAISQAWCDATNTEALEDLITNQGVKAAPLPVEILAKLRDVTVQTLNDNAAKDPLVKKVHDSYMGFKKGWDKWAAISEGVYHAQIRGQI
jgi:TRAP-type mannitol/chloroaromatic compound transport system substrate-binding protein